MRRIGQILASAAALAARAIGLRTVAAALPPSQGNPIDPVKRNTRQPERRGWFWARLLWDSAHGPAYRVHDAQGRVFYTALKAIPPARRAPRHLRRGHEAERARRASQLPTA